MNKIIYFFLPIYCALLANEHNFIDTMQKYVPLSESIQKTLHKMATVPIKTDMFMSNKNSCSLFRSFSCLYQELPYISLGDFPTPIYYLGHIEKYLSSRCRLYLKDDGLTGSMQHGIRLFGGNKVRKLEFLLADAMSQGARSVLTYGGIGSNHVVATAVCARLLGLHCIALLSCQSVTDVVKRNMLLMHENKVDMILNPNREVRNMQTIISFVQSKYAHNGIPYFIPTGGSCPLGIIGFVNAAFELKEQITQGIMPEPDYIYVATGSCGTLVGLMLGARAAGLKATVVGVAVEPDNAQKPLKKQIVTLLQETNDLLCQKDVSFPHYVWHENDICLRLDFGGDCYGAVTSQALDAISIMQDKEGLQLDTTYTGKACAGMFHDITTGKCDNSVVLFWNTFCSLVKYPDIASQELNSAFHQFFSEKI